MPPYQRLDAYEPAAAQMNYRLVENDKLPVLNGLVLQRGSYFSDRRDNEVIVNDAFAEAIGNNDGGGGMCARNIDRLREAGRV